MKLPFQTKQVEQIADTRAHQPGEHSQSVVPSGECGCSGNRHCLGPCVLGSCLGTCVPNV